MTTTTIDIDYKNNFFEHPELTRIVGEPSTAMLITLQAEIRDILSQYNPTLVAENADIWAWSVLLKHTFH